MPLKLMGFAALCPACDYSEFPLDISANQYYIRAIPCLQEGAVRIVHGSLARVAMDAAASGGLRLAGRDVGGVRRNRVVLAPRPWRYVGGDYPAGYGGKKGRSPGRSRISRKAI